MGDVRLVSRYLRPITLKWTVRLALRKREKELTLEYSNRLPTFSAIYEGDLSTPRPKKSHSQHCY